MKEQSKLKACPCCEKYAYTHEYTVRRHIIACSSCGLTMERKTREEVLKAWNTRSMGIDEGETTVEPYMADNRLRKIIKFQLEGRGGKINPKDDFAGFINDIKSCLRFRSLHLSPKPGINEGWEERLKDEVSSDLKIDYKTYLKMVSFIRSETKPVKPIQFPKKVGHEVWCDKKIDPKGSPCICRRDRINDMLAKCKAAEKQSHE